MFATINKYDLENWFTYHNPRLEDVHRYESIRVAGKILAEIIVINTPPGADQSAAIRKVREAVMTANAAIAIPQLAAGLPAQEPTSDPSTKGREELRRPGW